MGPELEHGQPGGGQAQAASTKAGNPLFEAWIVGDDQERAIRVRQFAGGPGQRCGIGQIKSFVKEKDFIGGSQSGDHTLCRFPGAGGRGAQDAFRSRSEGTQQVGHKRNIFAAPFVQRAVKIVGHIGRIRRFGVSHDQQVFHGLPFR